MFQINTKEIDKFSLPKRQNTENLLPRDQKRKEKLLRKTKGVETTKEENEIVENEYAFLPSMIGMTQLSATSPAALTQEKDNGYSQKISRSKTAGTNTNSSSDVDEVSVIMAGILNSDDAINFFARFGSETPVKFVHLIQDESAKVYSPYELKVTSLPDPSVEHYTMSSAGIVHVCPGQPSECTPLSNWMRQGMMFKILRNIPFYKYYLHRKAFTVWKDNVRFQLFTKQRKKIVDRLFYARKNSCQAILAAKKCLIELQGVKLLNLDLKTSDKDVFFEQQTTQNSKANAKFDIAMNAMCTEVNNMIMEVNNMYAVSKQDAGANAAGYSDNAVEKAKSLVKIKQEKAEKKLLRQRAKLEHQTLPEFIRLVDYIEVEFLASLAVNTCVAFYEELIKPRKAGIFETMVRFNTAGTTFSPTCQDIREMLEKLLENMINAVGNVSRVNYLNHNKYLIQNGPNIQSIVRENKIFSSTASNIQQRVISDFEKAEEHAQSYESIRPMYDFNITWDFEAYRAQQHDMASLKTMMELIVNWAKELEKLRNKPIGILEVDSKRLKGELNPMREARLQEIKEYIKDVARIRCSQLLDHFKESLVKLSVKPVHLKDFAHQVQVINAMKEDEKSIFKATSQVDQMYNLLQQYEVKVPSEDLVLHEDLHDRQQEYRKEIEGAQVYRESKMPEMVTAVEGNLNKLQDQLVGVINKLDDSIFNNAESFGDYERVLDELAQLGTRLENADNLSKTYGGYQKLFNVSQTTQRELEVGKEKWETLKALWDMIAKWSEKSKHWLESQFTELQVEEIDKEVQQFFKDSFSFNKKLNNNKISELFKDKISEFKAIMPNILDLGNPNMKTRHYEKIFKLFNESYFHEMPFTLSYLLKNNIMNHKDAVQEISASASGEAQLENSLEKIKSDWEKQTFMVMNHRDQHNLFILGSLEEIFTLLEDNQVSLQTMLGSRYIRGVQDRVDEWEKKLAVLSETLDEWVACQRTWMYLENIFGAEDIQKQLPSESQKFLLVDRSWKTIMNRTNADPKVLSCLNPLDNGQPLLDSFVLNNEILENIQKSLEEYLETKRMAFPRFYFLSNDELLEILSQTRDPHAVQPHMSKCFDAIKRIKFGEGRHAHDILGYLDPSGEYVTLSENVKAEGPVEAWLLLFEKGMRQSLYDKCKTAYQSYPQSLEGSINRKEWLWSYPAQVVICIDQVVWTGNTTGALRDIEGEDLISNPKAMEQFLKFSLLQIDAMVDLVRAPLDKQQRMLLGALLTIDVHARDVIRSLVAKNIGNLSEFEWTKQLRYYWLEDEDDCFVKQTNSSFRYGYEYLGNGPRLVITPLTDTCYM